MTHENWNGFKGGAWQNEINVRDFIQLNYKEYKGDASFLAGATQRTSSVMSKVQELFKLERQKGGVLDVDENTVSSLTSFAPGYIDNIRYSVEKWLAAYLLRFDIPSHTIVEIMDSIVEEITKGFDLQESVKSIASFVVTMSVEIGRAHV